MIVNEITINYVYIVAQSCQNITQFPKEYDPLNPMAMTRSRELCFTLTPNTTSPTSASLPTQLTETNQPSIYVHLAVIGVAIFMIYLDFDTISKAIMNVSVILKIMANGTFAMNLIAIMMNNVKLDFQRNKHALFM